MKTKEEILNQEYISATDLKIVIPQIGRDQCRNIIKEVQEDMKQKNLFIPKTQMLLAKTSLVKKKLGI